MAKLVINFLTTRYHINEKLSRDNYATGICLPALPTALDFPKFKAVSKRASLEIIPNSF